MRTTKSCAVRCPVQQGRDSARRSFGWPGGLLAGIVVAVFFVSIPLAWTQYPSPAIAAGSTIGAMLRSSATATRNQASLTRKAASDWRRRSNSASYNAQQFQLDYSQVLFQFQALREQFNALGNVALQLGRPRANNAVSELDAGLTIIGELFPFLEAQFNAGTLDRQTILRTCRALEDGLREWERELSKKDARIGVVW